MKIEGNDKENLKNLYHAEHVKTLFLVNFAYMNKGFRKEFMKKIRE